MQNEWKTAFAKQLEEALQNIQKWQELNESEQLETIGTLVMATGWLQAPRAGSKVICANDK